MRSSGEPIHRDSARHTDMKVDFSGQRSSGCPHCGHSSGTSPHLQAAYVQLLLLEHHSFWTSLLYSSFAYSRFHQFSTLITIFCSLSSRRTPSSLKCQSSVSHSDHPLHLSTLSLTLFYYLYFCISLKLPVIWPCCIFSLFSLCFLPSSLDLMTLM